MPARNSVKTYADNCYYHIYNRGVEKRVIFTSPKDYGVFLAFISEYLTPVDIDDLQNTLANPKTTYKEKSKIARQLQRNNFSEQITMTSYCLMPNHFHFLVRQKGAKSIDSFMNSLATRYSMYFNRKYKRVGPLYQGVYKAVLVNSDEQLVYLTRYIHRQTMNLLGTQGVALRAQPSSYYDFLGITKTSWIHPKEILKFFSKEFPNLSYKAFVENDSNSEDIISKVKID